MDSLSVEIGRAVSRLAWGPPLRRLAHTYREQDEFLYCEEFLPAAVVERYLLPEVDRLRPNVHRSYIPGFKKGGAIGYRVLAEKAPDLLALYTEPTFVDFLCRLVGARVMPCPPDDPHAAALYFYTEPGDHMGFHYDTSYYEGARYTVLMGLIQRSTSCRLVAQLYRRDALREPRSLEIAYGPGSLVIFNGDRLWHAVTPLGEGEERVVLSMEYVTNPAMRPFQRFVSNMKDAIAYFGPSALFRRAPRREPPTT